jgi:hypothetical protein
MLLTNQDVLTFAQQERAESAARWDKRRLTAGSKSGNT